MENTDITNTCEKPVRVNKTANRQEYMKKYRETDKYKEKLNEYKKFCSEARKKMKEEKLKSYVDRLDLLLNDKVIEEPTFDKIKKALNDTIRYPCRTNTTKINFLMSLYEHYNPQ